MNPIHAIAFAAVRDARARAEPPCAADAKRFCGGDAIVLALSARPPPRTPGARTPLAAGAHASTWTPARRPGAARPG